jgi:hypothetical protein
MANLMDLAKEIEAGKVVIPVWDEDQVRLFRSDQGKYLLTAQSCFFSGDTIEEIVDEFKVSGDDDIQSSHYHHLLTLPCWQVVDTSMPAHCSTGKTLLDLRHELEAGQVVSPLLPSDELPYCIRKEQWGQRIVFVRETPYPYQDAVSSCASVDELYARYFHAHFPIWQVGASPEFEAVAEGYRIEHEKDAAEQDAIDNAPPRTIEVSEREYRELLARRQKIETDELDEHPF